MEHPGIAYEFGPAEVVPGTKVTLDLAIAEVKSRFPDRSYFVVSDWWWIDFDAPEIVLAGLKAEGQGPAMILGLDVLHDSLNRFDRGDWIRSTPMVAFSEGRFFQTNNTVYVLCGAGRRTRMELSTVITRF